MAAAVVVLRRRRFRLFATLVLGAVVGGVALVLLDGVLGEATPSRLAANLQRRSWPAGAGAPSPAVFAGAAAVLTTSGPWTTRQWRRATWLLLLLAGAARVIAGTALPFELLLASPPARWSARASWWPSGRPTAGSAPTRWARP